MSAQRLQCECRVFDRGGQRPDLIEAAGVGDEAVAADAAVGWLDADNAAERRGLADRAAGIAAERDGHDASGDGCRAAAAAAAGHAGDIPRIERWPEARVFGARTHRVLVEVGLADDDGTGIDEALDRGGGVRRLVRAEHVAAAGCRAPVEAEVVLERDRHTGERADVLALGDASVDGLGLLDRGARAIGEDGDVGLELGLSRGEGVERAASDRFGAGALRACA